MMRHRLLYDADGWVTVVLSQNVRGAWAPPVREGELAVDSVPEGVEQPLLFVDPQTQTIAMPHDVEVAFARFKAAGESDEIALAKTFARDMSRLPDLPASVQLTQRSKARVVVDAASQAVKDQLRG